MWAKIGRESLLYWFSFFLLRKEREVDQRLINSVSQGKKKKKKVIVVAKRYASCLRGGKECFPCVVPG
jgi:hypothetical protein